MVVRLSEIELKEKCRKKKHKNLFSRGRQVLYASKTTGSDKMKSKLSPHITEE